MNDKDLFLKKIQQYFSKRIEIEKNYSELKKIKEKIYQLKEKSNNENDEIFRVSGGEVLLRKYVSEYSSILKKEFRKLPIEEKRKLYKHGLLNLTFRLNWKKYKKIKDNGEKNIIDNFVNERKNTYPYYLTIKKIDPNEIKGYYETPEEIQAENDEFLNDVLDEIYSYDPSYFTDDDYADLSEEEKDMLGIERE